MVNNQRLAQHHASVTVNAPVHQVYGLFTHFNDFPKFMTFVKEVTYYDDQRSHWVAQAVGQHEWDAVNDNWIEDRQIGWHSTNGLENNGRVTFQPAGNNQTQVDVYVNYNPPAGVLGDIGENLGAGSNFDSKLQHDLDNFAQMVDQASPGALDPQSSNYLFHSNSAAAKGTTTDRQNATRGDMNANTGSNIYTGDETPSMYRPTLDSDIITGNTDATNNTTDQGVMPEDTGVRNPLMPSETGTTNPVMPPEGTRNY
ncbi:MAG TPA: SRPBCC family protein [Ktedonobacteraceae bacterium]|nr:SRPBCC family protein [Ktedonobacteraceae bacterium]